MGQGAKLPVHIHDDCDVDYEVVNVRVTAGEEVEWHSDGPAFAIDFESSPFQQAHFDVPAGGCISSGPVKDGAPYARYHYTIQSKVDLAMSADPDVDVRK
jgi:hypothetical protein